MVLRYWGAFQERLSKVEIMPITHGGDQEMWVDLNTPVTPNNRFCAAAKLAMTRMREDLILMEDE